MRCILLAVLLVAVVLGSVSAKPKFRTAHLGRHTFLSKPRSLWMQRYGKGSNLAVGGSVWPTSIYWTTVQVGTPSKTYAVAIDSGSNALFLSAKGCDGCVSTPPNIPYDPSNSSTSRPVPGGYFNYSYETCNPSQPLQPCTIAGPLYTDVVSLAGYGPAPIVLGAIDHQTTNFYQFQTIDGIMGMVGGPVNQSVFLTLCVDGGYCEPVFGLCMNEGTHSNGTMTIGGVDESLSEGPIQYVPSPNASMHGWHEIVVKSITFAGVTVPVVPFGFQHDRAILDTGTNDLLLPTYLFYEAQRIICGSANLTHCNDFFNQHCFDLTEEEVNEYPNITFELENHVKLEMTARDYLLKNSPAGMPGQYCFGIANGGNFFIIGDTIMQNYYLVFAPQKVGWGKVNRNTCGSKPLPV